jgi:thiol:disulfide interchange protein DsbD
MPSRWFLLLVITLGCLTHKGWAQAQTEAVLVLDHLMARPGETLNAAVVLRSAHGWHTYWKNPGEAGAGGQATTIDWDLPEGVSVGAIEWPTPRKLKEEAGAVFAYERTNALLIPITLASNLTPRLLTLSAQVRWLECEKQCVPRSTQVSATLQIGSVTVPSSDAPSFEAFRKALPEPQRFPVNVSYRIGDPANQRIFQIEFAPPDSKAHWDFFPDLSENLEFGPSKSGPQGSDGRITILQPASTSENQWPGNLAGLLVQTTEDGLPIRSYQLSAELSATEGPQIASTNSPSKPTPFLTLLIFAFIGGLILNVMPCVLPVIALKILSFVRQGQESPARVRILGLMYGAGVLASFATLAAVMIGLSFAGKSVHQGVLFQSSTFLVLMTVLIVLISVNLLGAFEVSIGGKAVDTTSALAQKEGLSGAFFNGVLATILATPCSAPFLGVSIGYALKPGQSPWVTLLMYLIAGVGLAIPYVVLCFQPRWLKKLPKPGPWMNNFKTLMAFPMLGTAFWLFLLAADHYGPDDRFWLGLFLVVLSMVAWMFGEFIQRSHKRRGLSWGIIGFILLGAYIWLLESEMDWRNPPSTSTRTSQPQSSANHRLPWQVWSATALAEARESGKPVLVEFTANWCTTCQQNKRIAIEVDAVIERIRSQSIVPLLGDFTFEDPLIAQELRRFERAGVPLVLVYSINRDEPPKVLPEYLTESMVLEALQWATTRRGAAGSR